MTLLDTHAWLWWLSSPELLGAAARQRVGTAVEGASLAVSAISTWEAAMLVKKGRLELTLSVDDLIAHCETLPYFQFVPITARIAVASVRLGPLHPDPADRMIMATAQHFGAALVTKDERLLEFAPNMTIW